MDEQGEACIRVAFQLVHGTCSFFSSQCVLSLSGPCQVKWVLLSLDSNTQAGLSQPPSQHECMSFAHALITHPSMPCTMLAFHSCITARCFWSAGAAGNMTSAAHASQPQDHAAPPFSATQHRRRPVCCRMHKDPCVSCHPVGLLAC